MKFHSLMITKNGVVMIQYHNNLNKIALSNFNQRELSIFFTACSIMKDKGISEVNVTFSELEKIIGISFKDKNELVQYLQNLSSKLLNLTTNIEHDGVYISFVLFKTFVIDTNKNILTMKVNEDFSYILNDLTKNFTLFELQEFNNLDSVYSKNLYRLLKQFKTTGIFKIEMSEFRRLLDIPSKYRMCDINKRILSPAMNEVSNYFTSLKLNKIKEGRSIKYLEFTFNKERKSTKHEEHTIDISANIKFIEGIELSKSDILCPKCGKPLVLLTKKDGNTFWGHPDYNAHKDNCKQSYSTKDDIEIDRENRLKLLEDEKNRSNIEVEVKDLIDQHKDIVKLVDLNQEFLYIEQVEKKDLFQNNPVVKIKINSNTIAIVKQCIDEWS